MKVGSLLIDMAADVARLRADMNTAQGVVSSAVNKMQSAVDGLKKGIAGLAAGLTVGAFSAAIKNAIDAADEMRKLSQKTGVAVKDLAGLQLAFQQSGLGGDVLEKSMARLGRSMADGNKAFAAMGVNVKTAEGALRPMRDVLGDVADKFATYADGAAKTALAQEVFGKSGAEMIPFLNAGSEALAEMDEWAQKLGLTMSEDTAKKAEQFNDTLDLLGMGVQGVWRQIAAQMLPTLTTLAGEMLNSATDTGALTTASAVLGNTLKGLYTVAASGIQIFSNLGRFVGAAAAAIVAVTQGNFAGAKDIMAQVQVDNATAWQKQVDSLKRLWNDAGGAGVQAMATVAAAANRAAPIVEKPGNAAKKSMKAAKDEAMELYQQLTMKQVGLDPKFYADLNKLHSAYQKGQINIDQYRNAVELLTQRQEFYKDLQKDLISQAQLANKIAEDAIEADEKRRVQVEGQIKSAREMVENIKFETAALTMTNAERTVAIALRDLERQGIVEGTEAYRAYAEQIREAVLNKDAVEASIAAQKEIEDEWKKTTDQMGQSLTDALMQGGKSVAEYLKGLFRTLVLRPIIQPIGTAMSGVLASMLGAPGAAMAGQGGAGGAGGLLNIGSSLFGAGGMAGALMAGTGWMTGAASFGGIMGAAGSLIGTGTMAGMGAGLAMGAGALLPVIGPLAALIGSGAFSRKHEQHNLQGTFGGASGFEGTWHDYYRGGLFRSSKTEDTPLDSGTLKALRDAWKAQEAAVTDYAQTLGLATDKISGFTYTVNLKLKDLGDPEAAGYMDKVWQMVNEAISTGSNEMAERILGTWTTTTREVEETIKTGFWDDETFTTVKKTVEETTYAASEYAREGERAIDTLTRLATSLQATNAAFDMLGLSLYEASLAGGDMASKLIDQMGGMDSFGAQVSAYWQNYYTEAERHAYMTGKMTEALAAAGLEMPTTVAGFRALVDAQDLTTDAGRAAFTALMSVNAAFTEVYGNADAAAGSIAGLGDELAAMEPIVFGAASDLASVIEQGLLGTLTGAQLGEQMADVVMQGMYSAIAGGFSQQITALMVEGVLNPMIAAAMTGASMSTAVSQAAIDRVIQQAQAAAAAINAVLSDPGFQAAIQQVQAAVGSISVGIQRPEPIYDSYAAQNARALAAQREAERMADEAQRLAQQAAQEAQRAADEEARRQQGIMNERMGLTKQLLQLEGNTVLLRQIELEALDPSNRALQQRIWAIEDETAAAEKYKSALKDAQDFLGGFTKNIEEFIFKVSHAQADAQQSYQMAAAKFTAQMTLARGGDRDAMNGITSYADTLIGSIRRESTTGAEANLRIARVLGQLASLPKQISPEQLIVDAIASANTSLEAVLNTNFSSLDANVDGLLTAGELAASGLATNTQISALMARVDANGDGMISKQELANSRLQTLATEQCTTNTNLGNVTSAQNSTNSWLSQIQMADVGYSLSNVNAINAGAGATVAAINKTNASLGAALVRDYGQMPVVAQFSSDSPLFSIFAAINETNAWLYHIHGLETASLQYWIALLNNSAPVTVRSENRTPANGTVFGDGGYTGPGAKWEPAGVVHKGEVVWSQADVARWGGPGIVDALRQGAPGYADGGPVAVRVPQIYVPPVGRSNEETQALLREVLAELRAQRSDDRARHSSLAEPLQRMDRRGAKWDKDGLPAERTNEAIA